jgi:hypothetical protein
MDPYLESPEIWPDVHHGLISQIQAALNPKLQLGYVARVELRVYISDDDDPGRVALVVPDARVEKVPKRRGVRKSEPVPAVAVVEPLILPALFDEEIEEAYIAVKHIESESLVAIIEVLSPSNKIRGSCGRKSFMEKRRQISNSEVHWIEIDFLRAGAPAMKRPSRVTCDYSVLVSRAGQRSRVRYWPIGVRQPLPVVGIPLRGRDPDVALDLASVFNTVYDRGAYDRSLDYSKEPQPPLDEADAKWARTLLRGRK